MEHEQSEMFGKFKWKVENFSRYNDTDDDVYSEPFIIGGYPWQLISFLREVKTANMSKGWSRQVKFKLFLLNQFNSKESIIQEGEVEFNANCIWDAKCLVNSDVLNDPLSGFLVKDTGIIGAEVSICNSKNERQVNPESSLITSHTSGSQTLQMEAQVLMPKLDKSNCQNLGEPMDFNDFGKTEKVLVQLLDDICAQHPSLIECQQRRSRKFREWAFNALGRVLYFLKTRKTKDMNDMACKELQILWEDLEHFGFDLTWLKPQVQSALGMKVYVEKALSVERLKDNEVALELEIMRMNAKMVTLKVNLHAVRDLLKAQEFEEKDLDAEADLLFVKP